MIEKPLNQGTERVPPLLPPPPPGGGAEAQPQTRPHSRGGARQRASKIKPPYFRKRGTRQSLPTTADPESKKDEDDASPSASASPNDPGRRSLTHSTAHLTYEETEANHVK
ncbi:uncharacterized protein LOC110208811 [Phascolarctos cinereus]